jgi:tetratricopeptide (TPR) repeat protein
MHEKIVGAHHPNTARTANNLGALYHGQRKFAKADPLYRWALAVWEKALGPKHPDVGVCVHNLAKLHLDQHNYTQAEPLYEGALSILERSLGTDHPYLASLLKEYVCCCARQNEKGKLEP